MDQKQSQMNLDDLETDLKTNTTSRILMTPKPAANRAGAVYMLNWRLMIFTLRPCSPMKDNPACKAETTTILRVGDDDF